MEKLCSSPVSLRVGERRLVIPASDSDPFPGIGIETARALAVAKAHVFITARDRARGKEVAEEIKRTTGNDRVEMLQVDLTSLESVRHLAEQFRKYNLPLNLLICK